NMIGHQHAVISNFLVGADGAQKINISIVREGFFEVQESAFDVPEVDVKNLSASAKVADHVADLRVRILETLGNRSLAKIQAVIGAWTERTELLQALHASQHAMHSAKTLGFRHRRIVRVAGESHLVLFRHRYYPLQKIGNALPRFLLADRPGLSQLISVRGLL